MKGRFVWEGQTRANDGSDKFERVNRHVLGLTLDLPQTSRFPLPLLFNGQAMRN